MQIRSSGDTVDYVLSAAACLLLLATVAWPFFQAFWDRTDSNVHKRWPDDCPTEPSKKLSADARKWFEREYEVAAQMMMYEATHFWTASGAFLVGTSLVATLLDDKSDLGHPEQRIVVAVVGLVLCFFWYAVGRRCQAYTALRISQARELETKLGGSIFRAGRVFAEGRDVSFADQEQPSRVSGAARHLGIREVALLVPRVFAILFFYVLAVSVFG